jgi:hypothetical protein
LLKSIAARGIEATGIELQRLWSVNVICELRKRRGARTSFLQVVQRTK